MPTIKKIWGVVSLILVILVVIMAVFLLGSRILGYRVFNILTGSMEPLYSVGDLIYVKDVDPTTIKPGDVITFLLNEDEVVATHRAVRIDAQKEHIYTKGDRNDAEDATPVHFNNVVGVPQFSIPVLGHVASFIQDPPGMYIAIFIVSALLIVAFAPDLIKKKKPLPEVSQPISEAEQATMDENARLRAELEVLKEQLNQSDKTEA